MNIPSYNINKAIRHLIAIICFIIFGFTFFDSFQYDNKTYQVMNLITFIAAGIWCIYSGIQLKKHKL